ncbi:MAG: sterol desaturase family protein [Polaromonas sp.]|uniref:sterol desaturase family protein n=1 Tax=Polaromonas sp. TaxID=1869339 RepID=UPI00271B7283|nr:sterol desaturase family protein [Polaromonas sp.]MDO9114502.1 sterol desaturase family protein [Polaromonas sp.]MDP1886942.1 sterol desaturase family protein [Polaromonas sp.]
MDSLINAVSNGFSAVQQWLFEAVVQPALFALGLANFLEDAFLGTAWFMVGAIQILVLLAVFGPLQRWRPVEPVRDRATVRTDILYTLIHRLGLFRVALFLTLEPVFDELFGVLRTAGYGTFHLDQLWPGVTDGAVASFLIYLVAFDLLGYWIHRGQHQWGVWWRLHSLHHAQRQMTMWSDNRNHLLDDIAVDCLLVLAAQLIGVAPGQFIAIVALTQLSESLQHANVRLWFGQVGERLWVSPRFHRMHHSIGIGHEAAGKNTARGHNFGVLLPCWDVLFGTANFEQRYDPTGIRDQVEQSRNYGHGFWSQQWLGLKRLIGKA